MQRFRLILLPHFWWCEQCCHPKNNVFNAMGLLAFEQNPLRDFHGEYIALLTIFAGYAMLISGLAVETDRKRNEMPTFGETLSEKRKEAGLSQKDLAARICKEDGQAISPQYLNDLEHDRRNPPSSHLIEQFAAVLKIDAVLLYHCAGELPPDLRCNSVEEETVVAAYKAFRQVVEGESE